MSKLSLTVLDKNSMKIITKKWDKNYDKKVGQKL